MRKVLIVLVLTTIAFTGISVVGAGAASAVGLHQHHLNTPSGPVLLAKGFCQNPDLFASGARNHFVFEHFHNWIHLGPVPTSVGKTFDC